VVSATIHMNNPYRFLDSVSSYRIVGGTNAEIVALALPSFQLMAGSALIANVLRKGAIVLVTSMYAMFVVAQASALTRGLEINCGCFGDVGGLVSLKSVALTSVLLAASVWMALLEFGLAAVWRNRPLYEHPKKGLVKSTHPDCGVNS
jgi:putative oxidoreductase